jgi:uncharacterized membrane protein (DUF106 family)
MPEPTMPAQRQSGGLSRFIMITMFVFTIFVMFDPELRDNAGKAMGAILYPLIGFGHAYPLWTIFFGGMILVAFSTLVRHYFADWIKMAKSQKMMSAFNKELRDARISNNTFKIKKLTEAQPLIMKRQGEMSTSQLKPMIFTMLIAILIFMWLAIFIGELPRVDQGVYTISLPWESHWNIMASTVLPHWILLYSLVSIPFGQLLQRVLKVISYKKMLSKMDAGNELKV